MPNRANIQTKHGFSLIEVLVSICIIVVLLIGTYRINSFLDDNNRNIIRSTILDKYGQYISTALRTFPPESIQNTSFLILSNNTLSYSTNPLDKKTSAGFFTPEDPYISQQIDYIGSTNISSGIVFNTYKITIEDSVSGVSKIYFVTR